MNDKRVANFDRRISPAIGEFSVRVQVPALRAEIDRLRATLVIVRLGMCTAKGYLDGSTNTTSFIRNLVIGAIEECDAALQRSPPAQELPAGTVSAQPVQQPAQTGGRQLMNADVSNSALSTLLIGAVRKFGSSMTNEEIMRKIKATSTQICIEMWAGIACTLHKGHAGCHVWEQPPAQSGPAPSTAAPSMPVDPPKPYTDPQVERRPSATEEQFRAAVAGYGIELPIDRRKADATPETYVRTEIC